MSPIDLTKILKKYKSGWVALTDDYHRVVAHSDKLIDLQKKVKNTKNIVIIQAFGNYYNFVS